MLLLLTEGIFEEWSLSCCFFGSMVATGIFISFINPLIRTNPEPDILEPEIPDLKLRCNRVVALNPWVGSVLGFGPEPRPTRTDVHPYLKHMHFMNLKSSNLKEGKTLKYMNFKNFKSIKGDVSSISFFFV